ncbi:MAG: N-acetylmuramoyl-L-alanine amidase family 2 protein [Candidatus Peregrinibacteria bacterium GW2011_GWC2_39_14]|nr:MAG: N-acetylmuramoyl-L-alanine amidase family 2 [Candidatus Peregrinibacteria bacterium GW2011_GWA2_38_36]KKR06553.1 MAG: N-acetylmuramoyl-L-alanine amidase family 2 protein [Candidatus Peregrinibacteria bacterium GW2011_GWC2_39_14]
MGYIEHTMNFKKTFVLLIVAGILLQFANFMNINKAEAAYTLLKIISRAEWGADESWRVWNGNRTIPNIKKVDSEYVEKFSDELQVVRRINTNPAGQTLTWPIEYAKKITKFVIHHTDSKANLDNPKQKIREIYSYHALTRGWGDIGYNYIIDREGNIYEGRAGGESVIGAHAGTANTGSIGIAILGSYDNDEIPEKALLSLAALIREKSILYGIDPVGYSTFRGKNTPNILGHRDVAATTCPGKFIYSKLDVIRKLAAQKIDTVFETTFFKRQKDKGYDYDNLSDTYYVNIDPSKTRDLQIRLKNTGKVTWPVGTTLVVTDPKSFNDKIEFTSTALSFAAGAGDTATFTISMTSKNKPGVVMFEMAPFINNKVKLEKYIKIPVNIAPPVYTYAIVTAVLPQGIAQSGTKLNGTLELKNTGNVPWVNYGDNPVTLETASRTKSIGALLNAKVNPGEIGKFTFEVTTPNISGDYVETVVPVVKGIQGIQGEEISFTIPTYNRLFDHKVFGMSAPNSADAGGAASVWVKFKNVGGATWTKSGLNQIQVTESPSMFKMKSWTMEESKAAPGEVATIKFELIAPQTKGISSFRFKLKAGDAVLTRMPVSVRVRVYGNQVADDIKDDKGGNIRILLSKFNSEPVITANGNFNLVSAQKTLANFHENDEVTIKYVSGVYEISSKTASGILSKLTSTNPVRAESLNGAIFEIKNYENRPDWNTKLNDNLFRGTLEIAYYNGKLRLINELSLEDYIKGIGEVSNGDPSEKIKTIMILARTYAKFYIDVAKKFEGAPYNLDDNPNVSQKYLGYGFEKRSSNTVRAAVETQGIVVTYADKLVKTPYFSSSDGRTRSAKEIWGWTDTPYLQSVSDPYCKNSAQFGHGVGLSGCGATGMAVAGKTAEEIIKYFYQGVELKKMY